MSPNATPTDATPPERGEKKKRTRRVRPRLVIYACNSCGADSVSDDGLEYCRGRACPYCGDGVIQETGR